MQLFACALMAIRKKASWNIHGFRNALKRWVQTKTRHKEQLCKVGLSKAKNWTFSSNLENLADQEHLLSQGTAFLFRLCLVGLISWRHPQEKKQPYPPANAHIRLC